MTTQTIDLVRGKDYQEIEELNWDKFNKVVGFLNFVLGGFAFGLILSLYLIETYTQ